MPQDNLARNLRHLMDRAGHNPRMLSELCGVSQRAIAHMLKKDKIARIDTVDEVAQVYGLDGWHLISPTLINDLNASPTLSKLIDSYNKASPDGKRLIEQVADREAAYVSKSDT